MNLIFGGMIAFNQCMMMLGGFICCAIGFGIIGNVMYWQLRAQRVHGTIKGVNISGKFYKTVYTYMLDDGTTHESVSDIGTSNPPKGHSGDRIELLVFPHEPDKARRASVSLWGLLLGAAFAAPGIFLFYISLHNYPVTGMTWGVMGLMLAYFALRIVTKIKIKPGAPKTLAAARAAMEARRLQPQPATFVPIESLQDDPQVQALATASRKSNKVAIPVLFILGCGLLFGGYYTMNKVRNLEDHGLRAPGTVVRLEMSTSSNSTSYHPVVDFSPEGGGTTEFRSSFGSNPPSYHEGEAVTVLYLPDDPHGSAMIDAGKLNWLLPGLLGGFGLLLLVISLSLFKAMSAPERRI